MELMELMELDVVGCSWMVLDGVKDGILLLESQKSRLKFRQHCFEMIRSK